MNERRRNNEKKSGDSTTGDHGSRRCRECVIHDLRVFAFSSYACPSQVKTEQTIHRRERDHDGEMERKVKK